MRSQIYFVIPSEEEKYKKTFANGKTWHNNLWQTVDKYVEILHHYKGIVKKQGETYKTKSQENKKFLEETIEDLKEEIAKFATNSAAMKNQLFC